MVTKDDSALTCLALIDFLTARGGNIAGALKLQKARIASREHLRYTSVAGKDILPALSVRDHYFQGLMGRIDAENSSIAEWGLHSYMLYGAAISGSSGGRSRGRPD